MTYEKHWKNLIDTLSDNDLQEISELINGKIQEIKAREQERKKLEQKKDWEEIVAHIKEYIQKYNDISICACNGKDDVTIWLEENQFIANRPGFLVSDNVEID